MHGWICFHFAMLEDELYLEVKEIVDEVIAKKGAKELYELQLQVFLLQEYWCR